MSYLYLKSIALVRFFFLPIYNNVLFSFSSFIFFILFFFSFFSEFFFEKVLWFTNLALPLHSLLKNPAFLVVFS